jgi:hypothetical protein
MSDVNGAPAGAGEVILTAEEIYRQIRRMAPEEREPLLLALTKPRLDSQKALYERQLESYKRQLKEGIRLQDDLARHANAAVTLVTEVFEMGRQFLERGNRLAAELARLEPELDRLRDVLSTRPCVKARTVVPQRHQHIASLEAKGITDPEQILTFLREHHPELVWKKKPKNGKPAQFISAKNMMLVYRRSQKGGDDCNRSE